MSRVKKKKFQALKILVPMVLLLVMITLGIYFIKDKNGEDVGRNDSEVEHASSNVNPGVPWGK